jgi:hypothetical protein
MSSVTWPRKVSAERNESTASAASLRSKKLGDCDDQ